MIGAKKYEPNDLRVGTIETLFWKQITALSRKATERELSKIDIQFSDFGMC